MLDDRRDMSSDNGIQFIKGFGGDGDLDTDVLHALQVRFQYLRLAKQTVELGGVVKGSTCVEEWERFGVDHLACCEDRAVGKFDLLSGSDILQAAERALVSDTEQTLVDRKAEFWR